MGLLTGLTYRFAIWLLTMLLALALGIGVYHLQKTFQPKAGFWRHGQVTQAHYDTANNAGALDPGESIVSIYQRPGDRLDEWFCLVTNKRIIVYDASRPGRQIIALELAEIDEVSSWSFGDTTDIYLKGKSGKVLSVKVRGDKQYGSRMCKYIHEGMKANGNDPNDISVEDLKEWIEPWLSKE